MKYAKRFDAAIDRGLSKEIFDHLRNYLMGAFLLAIGTHEMKYSDSMLFGLIKSEAVVGVGVAGIAVIFLAINFYDGVKRISRSQYHLVLTIAFVTLYVFFSLRVIEMAWNFRGNAAF